MLNIFFRLLFLTSESSIGGERETNLFFPDFEKRDILHWYHGFSHVGSPRCGAAICEGHTPPRDAVATETMIQRLFSISYKEQRQKVQNSTFSNRRSISMYKTLGVKHVCSFLSLLFLSELVWSEAWNSRHEKKLKIEIQELHCVHTRENCFKFCTPTHSTPVQV